MTPLDAIQFDSDDYLLEGKHDGVRMWQTPYGDGLGLYYYPRPPDIDASLDSVDGVRAFYRAMVESLGLGVIGIDVIEIDGCPAIRTLFKAAQEPTGRTYVGSITIPFRDFSYVLKIQAPELGTTGVRDAVVMMSLMESGEIGETAQGLGIDGWLDDPYDPSSRGPRTRNKSEDRRYDELFAEHPLTRARGVLDHLEATTRVSPEVRRKPAFFHPPTGRAERPWWKPW